MTNYQDLIPALVTMAKAAGAAILKLYRQNAPLDIQIKKDKTPVTEADMAAHNLIKTNLQRLTPDVPILSEEAANIPFTTRQTWEKYWLIDPLDGTKEFIERTDEFTVNIALIEKHQSVVGVVYVPFVDWCYYAAKGSKAYKTIGNKPAKVINTRKASKKLVIAISRRHGKKQLHKYTETIKQHQIIHRGSSIKSGLIAEGKADLYPSFGPTSEWDTGASQCIIEAAGGAVLDLNLQPLQYNTKASLINPAFIVVGDPSYNWKQFLE